MKKTGIVIIISIFTIVLSACIGSSPTSEPNLEGVTWVLTTYNDSLPIEDTQPTIQFKNGEVTGNDSCNHYGGSYQIKGESISFSALFQTEMFCMDPEGVMEQERTYLELLGGAQRFEMVDGALTIFTDNQKTLIFEEQTTSS